MSRKTYYYKKKLSATNTQKTLVLPRLRSLFVLNYGNDNITIEPENDIDADSIVIPAGMSHSIGPDMIDLRYKAVTSTATIYVSGLRHEKA